MSSLKYYAYAGKGQANLKQHGYNQAVRVGDRIECAGQGKSASTWRSLVHIDHHERLTTTK
jgi:hypothetical protein